MIQKILNISFLLSIILRIKGIETEQIFVLELSTEISVLTWLKLKQGFLQIGLCMPVRYFRISLLFQIGTSMRLGISCWSITANPNCRSSVYIFQLVVMLFKEWFKKLSTNFAAINLAQLHFPY